MNIGATRFEHEFIERMGREVHAAWKAPAASPADPLPCPDCKGLGGELWMEPDGAPNGEVCAKCEGLGSLPASEVSP